MNAWRNIVQNEQVSNNSSPDTHAGAKKMTHKGNQIGQHAEKKMT